MTDQPDSDAVLQQQILDAFGLKAYHIGLAPVPRHVRAWWKLTAPVRRVWVRWADRHQTPHSDV